MRSWWSCLDDLAPMILGPWSSFFHILPLTTACMVLMQPLQEEHSILLHGSAKPSCLLLSPFRNVQIPYLFNILPGLALGRWMGDQTKLIVYVPCVLCVRFLETVPHSSASHLLGLSWTHKRFHKGLLN